MVSIAAANINATAMKVVEQIRNCPNQAYNMDVRIRTGLLSATEIMNLHMCYSLQLYRLEEMVTSTPVGLTGLRCFMVTKHFILTLISVVFTFEVVLLQSYAANAKQNVGVVDESGSS